MIKLGDAAKSIIDDFEKDPVTGKMVRKSLGRGDAMREQRISPSGFARLREQLLRSELDGYGPDDCARHALISVGLPHTPLKFIVDYSLDGPIYPFMDWP